MKIPEPTNTIAQAIYDSYKQGEPREHLGCSLLGHHCCEADRAGSGTGPVAAT